MNRSNANGPGKRTVIWVQGCNIGCSGCYNPNTWSFEENLLIKEEKLLEIVANNKKVYQIEGITVSGGEPILQAKQLLPFLEKIQKINLSVVLFSGFYINQIRKSKYSRILDFIDIIIDVHYQEEKRIFDRKLVSSSNKELIFLTKRYSPKDLSDDIIEINIDEKITITGFPSNDFLKEINLFIDGEK